MSTLLTRRTCLLSISLLGGSSLLASRSLSSKSSTNSPMAASSSNGGSTFPVTKFAPRHSSWPYSQEEFTRMDSAPDDQFYTSPRFVTHIDDAAIASLRQYYASTLPRHGRILDLCSSWISHYPGEVEDAAKKGELKVTGVGMNEPELARNEVLNGGRIVWDLNIHPEVPKDTLDKDAQGDIDAITCVVSIDYLTKPVEVLSSLRSRTKKGGKIHLIISNRCFPTKAMYAWMRADEDERLQMVGDYLQFSGWQDIEIVTVSDGKADASHTSSAREALSSFLSGIVNVGRDPLWVVRASNDN